MTRRALRSVLFFGALVVGAGAVAVSGLVSGCLEVNPITVPPKEASASLDGGCYRCIQQPQNCAAQVETCKADEAGCGLIIECVELSACFERATIDDKVNCGLPCVLEAGVTQISDPRVERLLLVLRCGQSKCGVACNLGDGGFDFDAL